MVELEVRCTCSRKFLLAKAGRDSRGEPYLQVRHVKNGEVFVHVLVTEGIVRVHCRNCCRWTKVTIRRLLVSRERSLPESFGEIQ